MSINKCPFCKKDMKYTDNGTWITYTCTADRETHVNTLEIGKKPKANAGKMAVITSTEEMEMYLDA